MRNTKQKSKILEIVKTSRDHMSAAEIFDVAKMDCPKISVGTVYRNLNSLAEKGTIRKIHISNQPARFDGVVDTHQHMFCSSCDTVFDIYPSVDDLVAVLNIGDAQVLGCCVLVECICKECAVKIN